MPELSEAEVVRRAHQDAKEGKSPSTQAGEFVREEIEHVRHGVHGARNIKQAIAIGLSKARRAGVKLPPPKKGTASAKIRHQAERDLKKGASEKHKRPSLTRSRAVLDALQRESYTSASPAQVSRQAKIVARRRGPQARHKSAMAAVRTKGPRGLRRAARKAAATRMSR
jgi:hypothetical protein